MKERPILFSATMVRAILEGRKTQTRRVVKELPLLGVPSAWCAAAKAQDPGWVHIVGDYRRFCPYGVPGDRLWVRETWAPNNVLPLNDRPTGDFIYRSDLNHLGQSKYSGSWHPSIHMPRRASRILLEIESVRVERLNDISDSDAIKEGVPDYPGFTGDSPVHDFSAIWGSINGPGSWDANPWVWVIQFKKIGEKGTK